MTSYLKLIKGPNIHFFQVSSVYTFPYLISLDKTKKERKFKEQLGCMKLCEILSRTLSQL